MAAPDDERTVKFAESVLKNLGLEKSSSPSGSSSSSSPPAVPPSSMKPSAAARATKGESTSEGAAVKEDSDDAISNEAQGEAEGEDGERVHKTLPNETQFGLMVVAAAAEEKITLNLDRDTNKVVLADGSAYLILDPYYALMINSAGEAQQQAIDAAISMLKAKMLKLPSDFAVALPNIKLRIRDRYFYSRYALQCEVKNVKKTHIDHRSLMESEPFLTLELMYDRGDAIETLHSGHFLAWNLSFDEIVDRVLPPFIESSTARSNGFVSPPAYKGLYIARYQDGSDSARLLCYNLIRSLPVQGRHVAVAASRDLLMVAGSEDPAGLLHLFYFVDKAVEAQGEVNCTPLILSAKTDTWKAWSPKPTKDAWYTVYRNVYLRAIGQLYHTQKSFLDEINKVAGVEEPLPARMTVMANEESGEILSYCVWQKGVQTLLPKCELVMFSDPEIIHQPVITRARWEEVMRRWGDHFTPQGLYPERYLVAKDFFPDVDELKALADAEGTM